MVDRKWSWLLAGLLCGALLPQAVWADPGLTIDAGAMRFIYTPGAGNPGSIGRIDVTPSNAASLIVQEVNVGADNVLGTGDDTLIDLAAVDAGQFNATFTADVFYLGANQYALVGNYTIVDAAGTTVLEGDFTSEAVGMSGQTLYLGGSLTNSDGILRPGSPSDSWLFTGTSGQTPDLINGLFGGADGVDGTVSLSRFRDASTLANLFEFQFIGSYPDLDAFFNSGIQASTLADVKVTVVVPAPGAALLGMMGLAMVGRLRRRLS